jgi:hypothetical protein
MRNGLRRRCCGVARAGLCSAHHAPSGAAGKRLSALVVDERQDRSAVGLRTRCDRTSEPMTDDPPQVTGPVVGVVVTVEPSAAGPPLPAPECWRLPLLGSRPAELLSVGDSLSRASESVRTIVFSRRSPS